MAPKHTNKFLLRLALSQGKTTTADRTDELVSILPSYHMYQLTISKNLTPTNEDLRTDPPEYELTPQLLTTSLQQYFAGVLLANTPEVASENRPFFVSPDADFTRWEDTILANSHKLKRLTSLNKELSKLLNVAIKLTESIGMVGEEPKIADPLARELRQGDCIYGFVTVTNTTEMDVPFDMFAVVLEGAVTFGDSQRPIVQPPTHIAKFLNMFDFSASWNDAWLDRLVTDHHNPHKVPGEVVDPYDGTRVQLNHKKVFKPHVTYKKFFTFKLPEKLLDCSCVHGLVHHLQLPPTLGVSKNEVISLLRQKWRDGVHKLPSSSSLDQTLYSSYTSDFAFLDLSVSYSISARIIGKASEYEHLMVNAPQAPHADEYVVASEDNCYLRAIYATHPLFELNRAMILEEARLVHLNMISRIKDAITVGKALSHRGHVTPESHVHDLHTCTSPEGDELQPSSSALELAKMQQSYYSKVRSPYSHLHRDSMYEVFLPYKKKTVLGYSKVVGLAALATPKTEYHASYVPVTGGDGNSATKIRIPLDLTFLFTEGAVPSVPDFKKVSVELVALTVKLKNLPIPMIIHPDMLFLNKSRGHDNFDHVTIKAFQRYASELSKLIKEHTAEQLNLDRDLILDVKAIASLLTKYDHLKILNVLLSGRNNDEKHPFLSSIPWETETLPGAAGGQLKYSKKVDLHVDLANAVSPPGTGDFCLVPDFQYCLAARMYYLSVDLRSPNGDKMNVKLPVALQRR